MKNYLKSLCTLILFCLPVLALGDLAKLAPLTYDPQAPRLSVSVSEMPMHRVWLMAQPSRLVMEFAHATYQGSLPQPNPDHPWFGKAKLVSTDDGLKISVDLKNPAELWVLGVNDANNRRLNVNLSGKAVKAAVATSHVKTTANKTKSLPGRDLVIAIDAGHGGNDPGAKGEQGTEEKTVTLAMAQKLAALVDAQPGMKAVLVRKNDDYVGLRQRMQIARAAKADLFLSIHADAVEDTTVRGASVFMLSTKGASSEAARWLEKSENASELVGGVNLSNKEDLLATVLLDLSQAATLSASQQVAEAVLKRCNEVSPLHFTDVQKAGFIVLKSPDVPSILVETAFISNPDEERNLLNPDFQNEMAKAIFQGIYDYFKISAPIDSRMASL